ncbi:SDR family oxidoreductase [Achromobacter insuavis]
MFSSHGHPLLLLARRLAPMQALNLPNALARQVDVTDRAALAAALREAEAQYGPADAIVNNAGVMLLGDITRQDPAQWDRMLDVNVKGLLNGVHAVAAGMVERGHGTIINISSVAGRKTFPNHVAYVGTKFAVHGLSENLREELSPHNVRVVTIAPARSRPSCSATPPTKASRAATRTGRPTWAARCWPPRTWPTRCTTPTRNRLACASARSCWRRPASRPEAGGRAASGVARAPARAAARAVRTSP